MMRFNAAIVLMVALVIFLATARPSVAAEYFDQTAFAAAAGSLTIIDFDDRPHGNNLVLGNAYTAMGLTLV
ncbi:MAG: hypothetical protein WD669_11485 [Pirellulales bacterium]